MSSFFNNLEPNSYSTINKTFYGFRYNPDDGNLQIEIINDGSLISLPQTITSNISIIDKYDYKVWFWSRETISFDWSNNGHLTLEYL